MDLSDRLKDAQTHGYRTIIGVFADGFSLSLFNVETEYNECHFFKFVDDLNCYLRDFFLNLDVERE